MSLGKLALINPHKPRKKSKSKWVYAGGVLLGKVSFHAQCATELRNTAVGLSWFFLLLAATPFPGGPFPSRLEFGEKVFRAPAATIGRATL